MDIYGLLLVLKSDFSITSHWPGRNKSVHSSIDYSICMVPISALAPN